MNTKIKILHLTVVILLIAAAGFIGYKTADLKYRKMDVKASNRVGNNIPKQTVINKEPDSKVKNEKYVTNPKDLLSYVSLTKDEVFQRLGRNYEMSRTGAEGSVEGFYYPTLGITFAFNDEDNKVSWMDCNEKVEINGAKTGMNFEQIQEKLGLSKVGETWEELPEFKLYEIRYKINDADIRFTSSSKEGTDSFLRIY